MRTAQCMKCYKFVGKKNGVFIHYPSTPMAPEETDIYCKMCYRKDTFNYLNRIIYAVNSYLEKDMLDSALRTVKFNQRGVSRRIERLNK